MKNEDLDNTSSDEVESDSLPQNSEAKDSEERLERIEAALKLLLEHMRTSTRGSEILEGHYTRSLLSSIAFGFSAISLIAMWSIDLASDEVNVELLRFTIGMSFLLLASVVDLASVSLLRKVVNRAVLEKDPSVIVIWQERSLHRFFRLSYWTQIKRESPDFYHHQLAHCAALVIYIVAGVFLIWAVFAL